MENFTIWISVSQDKSCAQFRHGFENYNEKILEKQYKILKIANNFSTRKNLVMEVANEKNIKIY